jgi:hypothetical protein
MRRRAARLAALLASAGGALALCAAAPAGPAQPIRFNHRIHAGVAGIGCTSCHAYAERGPVAGIPSMDRCRGCHKFVKEDSEHPELTAEMKPLLDALEAGTAIEWVRVHRVPDHVYFTHERHVLAGVKCQDCHGEVEKMDVMHQVSPLTMGWCLACHHEKQREKPGALPKLTECVTCHK